MCVVIEQPSWVTDMINRHKFERGSPRTIWTKYTFCRFIKLIGSEEAFFLNLFNKSEAMMTILDVSQGHRTRFW